MWGGSHGGCITTRAAQRGAPVHAAADVFGPADLATNYRFWVDQIEAGSGPTAGHGLGGDAGTAMLGDLLTFLMAKLPP